MGHAVNSHDSRNTHPSKVHGSLFSHRIPKKALGLEDTLRYLIFFLFPFIYF